MKLAIIFVQLHNRIFSQNRGRAMVAKVFGQCKSVSTGMVGTSFIYTYIITTHGRRI